MPEAMSWLTEGEAGATDFVNTGFEVRRLHEMDIKMILNLDIKATAMMLTKQMKKN